MRDKTHSTRVVFKAWVVQTMGFGIKLGRHQTLYFQRLLLLKIGATLTRVRRDGTPRPIN